MTNYEKYKDFIREHVKLNKPFGIMDDIPRDCQEISCAECTFGNSCYSSCYVSNKMLEFFTWLDTEEVKEPYILTKEELAFCLMVKTGYLWRGIKYNNLFYSKEKPTRDQSTGYPTVGYINLDSTFFHPLLFPSFDFVKNELISIKDILNNYIISGDNNG